MCIAEPSGFMLASIRNKGVVNEIACEQPHQGTQAVGREMEYLRQKS